MRLAEFIRRHRDEIVADWQGFARAVQPAAGATTHRDLREDGRRLLEAAAQDLESSRSRQEQRPKSWGAGPAGPMAAVSQEHAAHRMQAGFRLPHVLAEYRALRASVVRLWEEACPRPSAENRRELARFHEAVDEALTEAVDRYNAQLERYRDQFLAVLGHDLRNPLNAISLSAASLSQAQELTEKHAAMARRIMNASSRMTRMVGDLLDLTRTRLGGGIPLARRPSNLGTICRQVVEELETTHPGRKLTLECTDSDLTGDWDSDRVAQIVANLVANALQHGDPAKTVAIRATSTDTSAVLTVHNQGKAIPRSALATIFDPMVQLSEAEEDAGQKRHLGLGLFIVRELAIAHGGKVLVTSSPGGTTFTVLLPRHERSQRKRPGSADVQQHPAEAAAPPTAG